MNPQRLTDPEDFDAIGDDDARTAEIIRTWDEKERRKCEARHRGRPRRPVQLPLLEVPKRAPSR